MPNRGMLALSGISLRLPVAAWVETEEPVVGADQPQRLVAASARGSGSARQYHRNGSEFRAKDFGAPVAGPRRSPALHPRRTL